MDVMEEVKQKNEEKAFGMTYEKFCAMNSELKEEVVFLDPALDKFKRRTILE